MCNLDDQETMDLISENIYMQYFPGYSSFTDEKPFDASLFVDFRKRLGIDNVNVINELRIVSIHQPHVRHIVRGKQQAKVEFGAKIHLSVIDGISFLDELSWEAYNEGSHMMEYIEKYRKRFGFYPREVLADKIYCNRANRAELKAPGIKLIAKPHGRPPALSIHVSPGERNPVEGKFGQAKTGYGLNRIKARIQGTSESWIATIILVFELSQTGGSSTPAPLPERG